MMRNICFATVGLIAASVMAREVKVSSFGFDPEDSTRFIQAAIDSGAEKVIFDKMPSPWVSLPLRGASKQELFFEPGVELVAKKGAFLGKEESLITFRDAEDVSLVGHGATLRMHKSDYFQPPYEKSEWRHALSIHSCRRVKIEGIAIRDSGGDAIYIGRKGRRKMPYCEDVVIRDVLCDGNNRQGISVISVKNFLIERCRLNNTSGSNPQAISSSLGSFYFYVKKGETFRFYASGTSYEERVSLMLCDSNGKAVWDKENLLFPEVFTCKAEVGGDFGKDVFLH